MKSNFFVKKTFSHSISKTCFVLGNGPSLSFDMKLDIEAFNLGDVFCVNQFAETELYNLVKPQYYVFADRSYWVDDESDSLIQMRHNLFIKILEQTTWNMNILVPFEAKVMFERVFKDQLYINIICYNNVPLYGAGPVIHKLYDLGLGNPEAQNVLIPSIFLAVMFGYKKVVLLGADHSWHETLELDSINRVCMKDKHFYNTDVELKPFTMGGRDEKTFTMDSLFLALAKMFEGYWIIERYAKYRNVEVINASNVTYVDAFKRMSFYDVIEELKAVSD